MKFNRLGTLDLRVSEGCFGTLPMGPLQANIPLKEGVRLLRKGYEGGITFFDTAELYQTYPYLKAAFSPSDQVIIASKSLATSYEGMKKSVHMALKEMDRDVIDIFHLHAARATRDVLTERAGALEYLVEARQAGLIRAVGISTHAVDVVEQAVSHPDIDVIFPLVNLQGIGILRGGLSEMLQAVQKAFQAGKGLYAMKALAGGHLIDTLIDALDFVRNIRESSALAVGIVREVELDFYFSYFANQPIPPDILAACQDRRQKQLIMLGNCRKCERCLETCPAGAIESGEEGLTINAEKCLVCGYCVPVCPEFNLRLA